METQHLSFKIHQSIDTNSSDLNIMSKGICNWFIFDGVRPTREIKCLLAFFTSLLLIGQFRCKPNIDVDFRPMTLALLDWIWNKLQLLLPYCCLIGSEKRSHITLVSNTYKTHLLSEICCKIYITETKVIVTNSSTIELNEPIVHGLKIISLNKLLLLTVQRWNSVSVKRNFVDHYHLILTCTPWRTWTMQITFKNLHAGKRLINVDTTDISDKSWTVPNVYRYLCDTLTTDGVGLLRFLWWAWALITRHVIIWTSDKTLRNKSIDRNNKNNTYNHRHTPSS